MQLICKYEDMFSKNKLDCGRAKDLFHRIHLADDRHVRLPYRRVPPAHYHKLRQVLSEMEEHEIIRKSSSEWASPLVLIWKKNVDLRICVDYRWLNACTTKDAHPLHTRQIVKLHSEAMPYSVRWISPRDSII